MQNEFVLSEFLQGSITGIFFITGSICQTVSLKTGPGGPINALITTQIVYQTSLNALFFDQGISNFEYGGISFGILAAITITLGDSIIDNVCGKKGKDQDEDYKKVGDDVIKEGPTDIEGAK